MLKLLFSGYKVYVPQYKEPLYIYRGRICEKPSYIGEITHPAVNLCTKPGRLNDIKKSIFYGATSQNIILFELRAEKDDTFVFSKWRAPKGLILNHIGFSSEVSSHLNSNRSLQEIYEFVKETKNFNNLNNFIYSYLSSKFICQVNAGEEYKYKLTIAIGQMLMMGKTVAGLLYPSLAMFGNADNVALKTSYVDTKLEFVNISFGKVIAKINEHQYKTQKTLLQNLSKIRENFYGLAEILDMF